MTKKLLHVKDVLCPMVFHGGLPMSERVKGDLAESLILKFMGCSFPLPAVASSEMFQRTHEGVRSVLRQEFQHRNKFAADPEHSGVAAFLRSNTNCSIFKVQISHGCIEPAEYADRLWEMIKKLRSEDND